jgi:hypothetical protein
MEDFGSLLGTLQTDQQSIMAFLDRLKQHTVQYPEPNFAALRRVSGRVP